MKRIAIYHNDPTYIKSLINQLSKKLPHHDIVTWEKGIASNYLLAWKPDEAIFSTPNLEVVFALGAGIDAFINQSFPSHIKLARLEEAGMGDQMLEVALYGILHHARDMINLSKAQKNKEWLGISTPKCPPLSTPIGIMGLGQLGGFIAKKLSQIGYPVYGYSRTLKNLEGITCYDKSDLSSFLSKPEVLINLMPLTEQTENILNLSLFNQLSKGAYLINIARGRHLVEKDLLVALDKGQLSGALLDVFRTEPLPKNHPFWENDRITILPHLAAITLQSEAVNQISRNINAFENQLPLTGNININKGY